MRDVICQYDLSFGLILKIINLAKESCALLVELCFENFKLLWHPATRFNLKMVADCLLTFWTRQVNAD